MFITPAVYASGFVLQEFSSNYSIWFMFNSQYAGMLAATKEGLHVSFQL